MKRFSALLSLCLLIFSAAVTGCDRHEHGEGEQEHGHKHE